VLILGHIPLTWLIEVAMLSACSAYGIRAFAFINVYRRSPYQAAWAFTEFLCAPASTFVHPDCCQFCCHLWMNCGTACIIWRAPERWAELVALEELAGFGAGIVLADDSDTLLCRLSASYLHEAGHEGATSTASTNILAMLVTVAIGAEQVEKCSPISTDASSAPRLVQAY